MIISSNLNQQALKGYSNITRVAKTTEKAANEQEKEMDEVVLSPTAQKFGSMMCQLRSFSDVRRDLVQSIGERVKQGTYHVDATVIADKMLSDIANKKS
jgi:flagellar biosynthesis anti-sigma factor FlgM